MCALALYLSVLQKLKYFNRTFLAVVNLILETEIATLLSSHLSLIPCYFHKSARGEASMCISAVILATILCTAFVHAHPHHILNCLYKLAVFCRRLCLFFAVQSRLALWLVSRIWCVNDNREFLI